MTTTAGPSVYPPKTGQAPVTVPGPPPPSAPPLRLSLVPAGNAPARIDGAWWPYSRDLTAELPALVAVLDERWHRITRVTVNPTRWPVVPHKVQVQGHVVKVGWFKEEQDPHQLMLMSYRTDRWDLLIVPPETSDATAAWLMAAGADPLRTSTGSQLIAEAGAGGDPVGSEPAGAARPASGQ